MEGIFLKFNKTCISPCFSHLWCDRDLWKLTQHLCHPVHHSAADENCSVPCSFSAWRATRDLCKNSIDRLAVKYEGCLCCFCEPEAKTPTYFICLSQTHLVTKPNAKNISGLFSFPSPSIPSDNLSWYSCYFSNFKSTSF